MPQLLEQYSGICATLFSLLPQLAEALRRQAAAWPQRLSLDDPLDNNVEAVAANPLFLHLLQSTTVRDVGLERLLTGDAAFPAEDGSSRIARRQSSGLVHMRAGKAVFHQRVRFCSHAARKRPGLAPRRRDRKCACVARRNRTDAACRGGNVFAAACHLIQHGAARTRGRWH